MSKPRYDLESKATIVLEALRHNTPVEVLSKKYGIQKTVISLWLHHFIEGGRLALSEKDFLDAFPVPAWPGVQLYQ